MWGKSWQSVLSRQDASTADCPNKDGPCCLEQWPTSQAKGHCEVSGQTPMSHPICFRFSFFSLWYIFLCLPMLFSFCFCGQHYFWLWFCFARVIAALRSHVLQVIKWVIGRFLHSFMQPYFTSHQTAFTQLYCSIKGVVSRSYSLVKLCKYNLFLLFILNSEQE